MGLFTEEIQKTSVSMYIERLSNLEEVDWYLLQQLTESIQMQSSGPREAIETIRKKLKHGGNQQKLRVLEVLKLLMENSSQQFHRQFLANEKMKERFELMLTSGSESAEVKNTLLSLLGAWITKYKNEPGMRTMVDLYELGRGKKMRIKTNSTDITRSATDPIRSPTSPMTQSPLSSPTASRQPSLPPPPIMPAKTYLPEPPKKPKARTTDRSSSGNNLFNFEKLKPKIMEEVALANQNANNLINSLKLINTSEDRWEIDLQYDRRVQECRERCEESRKKIVRYARLIEDEEWIGTLLAANEDLLKALDMYDIMLTGEIPAAWREGTTKLIRSPPPPPPPIKTSPPPLQIEFSNLNLNKEEELDPFADPTTPIEEINAR
ncbi:hypothetical protein G6F46_006486 [Rhizopus delemar]|nr:hypothetical protein G6F43_011640 [Rhizopus delemar]KAG1540434.1 hypothetical protein G6F51_008527 [Rhizopus arrhizus]KAG1451666.1 hypothetical protein G6F55_009071 [Rhizopus delemar]KAG1493080.1 hypothetical protein G6F54_008840 [Rhizopus delemar]KAG1506286.1 hypothetical protein G6F53_009799 [Rhizopus delemar]